MWAEEQKDRRGNRVSGIAIACTVSAADAGASLEDMLRDILKLQVCFSLKFKGTRQGHFMELFHKVAAGGFFLGLGSCKFLAGKGEMRWADLQSTWNQCCRISRRLLKERNVCLIGAGEGVH